MERDIHFLLHPEEWPSWPMCPVKRRDASQRESQVGVVWADGQAVVILTNMFSFDADAPKLTYESMQELVAAGWRVD